MFYPELLGIGNNGALSDIIDAIDTYLGLLPSSQQDKISAVNVSVQLKIDFNIAESILEACCRIGILEKQFEIRCPECEGTLKITDSDHLIKELNQLKNCYICDSENITVKNDYIFILYKLVKKPTNSPDKLKKYADSLFGNKVGNTNGSPINDQIEKKLLDPNRLYYHPVDDEINELKHLYESLTVSFDNTTEQGNALNDLAIYLLNLVECFRATEVVRSTTNQFDCTVYNTACITPSVLEDIGSYFVVECKHEEQKPNNTYYHKIMDILRLNHLKFGIVFSMLPITKTCNIIARQSFLDAKIIVVNIYYKELHDIIYDDVNFLELIACKMAEVKLDPTTKLENTNLFTL